MVLLCKQSQPTQHILIFVHHVKTYHLIVILAMKKQDPQLLYLSTHALVEFILTRFSFVAINIVSIDTAKIVKVVK